MLLSKLLYSTAMSTSQGEDEDSGVLAVRDGATYMPFRLAGATITARASSMIEEASERTDSGGHVQIVRALACALCRKPLPARLNSFSELTRARQTSIVCTQPPTHLQVQRVRQWRPRLQCDLALEFSSSALLAMSVLTMCRQ